LISFSKEKAFKRVFAVASRLNKWIWFICLLPSCWPNTLRLLSDAPSPPIKTGRR